LWNTDSETPAAHKTVTATRSPLTALLGREFARRNLLPNPDIGRDIQRNAEIVGRSEWASLNSLGPLATPANRATNLLGLGYVLTEFLAAPAVTPIPPAISSLGGLVNLMVVVCDQLLDGGFEADRVLPRAELAAGGGGSSPVMLLLGEYFRRLAAISLNKPLLSTIETAVRRMFEAERQTVIQQPGLSYGYWLRKSSLPFVVMALPSWHGSQSMSRSRCDRHLNWLYRVGRFFGALDDAVDFEEDERLGHPNRWQGNSWPGPVIAKRIADWGDCVVGEWDSLVPKESRTAVLRETFLYIVWGWLRTAPDHPDVS
jgi:hypothetical protein